MQKKGHILLHEKERYMKKPHTWTKTDGWECHIQRKK